MRRQICNSIYLVQVPDQTLGTSATVGSSLWFHSRDLGTGVDEHSPWGCLGHPGVKLRGIPLFLSIMASFFTLKSRFSTGQKLPAEASLRSCFLLMLHWPFNTWEREEQSTSRERWFCSGLFPRTKSHCFTKALSLYQSLLSKGMLSLTPCWRMQLWQECRCT